MNKTKKTGAEPFRRGIWTARLVSAMMAALLLLSLVGCGDDIGVGDVSTSPSVITTEAAVTTDLPSDTATDDPLVSGTTEDLPPILSPNIEGMTFTVVCNSEAADLVSMSTIPGKIREKHGVELILRGSRNIFDEVNTRISSGDFTGMDLLLPSVAEGVQLTVSGALQDLSQAGIEISGESHGVNKSLTESITVGGGTYLLFSNALTSDIYATSAVLYRSDLAGGNLGYDPVSFALNGELDVENFIVCANYAGVYAQLNGGNSLTVPSNNSAGKSLLLALGGRIFTSDTQGLPCLAPVDEGSALADAYADSLKVLSHAKPHKKGVSSILQVTTLGAVSEGEIYLPLPCAKSGKYISPVDLSRCSVLAVPNGIVNGRRTAALLSAISECGNESRSKAIASLYTGSDDGNGAVLAGMILNSQTADTAALLGWGDFDDFFGDGLASGTTYAELMKDKTLSDRQDTLATAVAIVAERLGLKKGN